MIDARRGVRPTDGVLTCLLVALGASMMLLDILSDDPTLQVDTRSWWMLPVFLLAFVAVLWWRRNLLAVIGFATVVLVAHDFLFGHLGRCGAGLPLAFVLAFLAGLGYGRRRGVIALALTGVLATAVLIFDTAAGTEALPVVLVILVVLWAIGQVARSRSALADELRRRNRELQALREERAALEVADDRQRVSQELETLLDERLSRLEATAEAGTAIEDPQRAREVLLSVEEDSRRTLDDMRQVVGVLRGGEVTLAPTPSVAHMDALLSRMGQDRLTVSGDPRVLPASLELSAYRIVEHLVGVLADDADARVAVQVRFAEDALEIHVAGPVPRGADLRAALARARERARLHAGSLDAKVTRGQARVVAHLPVLNG
jgi:signal transduction histidine kinase